MESSQALRAVDACRSVAAACGLSVDEAGVLQDSNRLTVRLRPCEVVARVAPASRRAGAAFEVEVARRLAETAAPAAPLDPRVEPRVFDMDGFAVTLWTFCEPVAQPLTAAACAAALDGLHAGMREIDPTAWAPSFLDRVDEAQRLVDAVDHEVPISRTDRSLVSDGLRTLRRRVLERGAPEQLLHGEPHPGNIIRTADGPRFIDLETCCTGPVELDLAHATLAGDGPPHDVAAAYPGADLGLVRDCWLLSLALATAWRCEPGDDLPDGAALAAGWIRQLRHELDR